MNIEEEKEASRKRVELKRAEELGARLYASQPGGSTLEQYMAAGLERWPGMSKEQHTAIMRILRNRIEGEDDVARSQVGKLKTWLRKHIRAHLNTDPTITLKAPETFALAQDAGVVSVTYETFRTQYFYPIRDAVREEFGIPKPVRKGQKKVFKTKRRQVEEEKKAREQKKNAEAASDLLAKKNGKPKREKRPHPLPLKNTMSAAEADAVEMGKKEPPEPPTYPEVTPPVPPSGPQVVAGECNETLPYPDTIRAPKPSPGSEEDSQRGAKSFPFEHSTEVHEKSHRELREEYKRNRDRFVRDIAGDTIEEPSLDNIEGEGEALFPVDDEYLEALEKEYSIGRLVEGRVRAKIGSMLENQRASMNVKNEDGWIEMHRPESGGVFLEIRANDLEAFDRFMELLSVVLKPLLKV